MAGKEVRTFQIKEDMKNNTIYLDNAARAIETACSFKFGPNRCANSVQIYAYLKNNGFQHSTEYTRDNLKDIMIFIIKTLENFNLQNNTFKIIFDKNVLIYERDENDKYKKDKTGKLILNNPPYVEGENLDVYKEELRKVSNDKLKIILGFTPDMIKELKPEAATTSATTSATPSLLDLKSGKIDDIEPLNIDALNKMNQ